MSRYAKIVYDKLDKPKEHYDELQQARELYAIKNRWDALAEAFDNGNLDKFAEVDRLFYTCAPIYATTLEEFIEEGLRVRPRSIAQYMPILISLHPLAMATLVLRHILSCFTGPIPYLPLADAVMKVLETEVELLVWSALDVEAGGGGLKEFLKRFPNPGERVVRDWLKDKRKIGLRKQMPTAFRNKRIRINGGLALLKLLEISCPDVFQVDTVWSSRGSRNFFTFNPKIVATLLNDVSNTNATEFSFIGPMLCIPRDYERKKDEKEK